MVALIECSAVLKLSSFGDKNFKLFYFRELLGCIIFLKALNALFRTKFHPLWELLEI